MPSLNPLRVGIRNVRCDGRRKVWRNGRELQADGHPISPSTVAALLPDQGYRLQSPRKVHEGSADHPDRDDQFPWIHDQIRAFQEAGQPVISVDTKS